MNAKKNMDAFYTLASLRRSLDQHARMVERERDQQRHAVLESVQALMEALEARDLPTRGHAERVRGWAVRIGRQLGLPAAEVEQLSQASRLHDIGKVGIRDAILEKPGPLSAEEWQIMRRHPLVGVAILQPIQFLRFALPVVRGHHERWDGKGYPDGLRGEAIPLAARIVAVADAYDALVTDRVYRQAFDRGVARRILQSDAGRQWDERVVAAFLMIHGRSPSPKDNGANSTPDTRDPVCGMAVSPAHTQARAQFQDHTYYFCSSACREAFDQSPESYA